MHQIMVCLFAFDARFFCLSAAQNAPPTVRSPVVHFVLQATRKMVHQK